MLSSLKSTANAAFVEQDSVQTLSSLDTMINRMQGLKRKMETIHAEEKVLHLHSRKRLQHLQDLYEIPSLADVKYDEWSRVRLNRLLVDYLLRSGYGESARALAREKGIEELVDLDVFVQCHKIKESLRQRNTQECLAWCAENRPMMRKISVRIFRLFIAFKILTIRIYRAISNFNFGYNSILSFVVTVSFWKPCSMPRNSLLRM